MSRRAKMTGAAVLVLLGASLALTGQPTIEDRIRWQEEEVGKLIAGRDPFIDPGELLEVKHNRDVRSVLLDVRGEADYNRFHLIDAYRIDPDDVHLTSVKALRADWVKVVMSNDEAAAVKTWKRLKAAGVPNVYILAGGVNLWLDIFREGREKAPVPKEAGDDRLRHEFKSAVGDRLPAANPDPHHPPKREFKKKVKLSRAAGPAGGGCG